MKKEIFRDVMSDPLKIQYDTQCKRVLGNKIILAWILKYAVKEFASFTLDEIVTFIEGEPEIGTARVNAGKASTSKPEKITGSTAENSEADEGSISYDIRFFAYYPVGQKKIKIIINVEAQKKFRPGYSLVTRGVFYGARMISSQQGREFTVPHYDDIKKIYSVWVCLDAPNYIGNAIAEYSMNKKDIVPGMPDIPKEYDKISVVMVCLNGKKEKFDGYETNRLAEMLNILFSLEISGEEKIVALQNDFGIEMEYGLEKEMKLMCNLSDYVEEYGMKKGMQEGTEYKTRVFIRNLLSRGMKDEDICALAECDQSMVEEVRESGIMIKD